MGNMNINSANVEGSAAQIANAANCFQIRNLSSQDSRSKISANANGKRAFQEAQANMQAFAAALDQDAANIRSLNVAFHQYDAMISDMLKNG